MDRRLLLAALLLGSTSCASATCRPASIVVADKEERGRVDNASRGLYRTTETGRLEPAVTPEIVRQYWLRSAEGEWYRVSAEQYGAAEVGAAAEVCR